MKICHLQNIREGWYDNTRYKINNIMEKINLAISAYVLKDNEFLLLKRVEPPYKWCPPGGRVLKGEGFKDAVKREVKEESGIEIEVLMPMEVWFGSHQKDELYAVSFLCKYVSGDLKTSKEHSEAKWLTIKELGKIDMTHELSIFEKSLSLLKFIDEKNKN